MKRQYLAVAFVIFIAVFGLVLVPNLIHGDELSLEGVSQENWVTIDVDLLDGGDFTLLTPAGWEFEQGVGMDAQVGTISGDGITLQFAYGMFIGNPIDATESGDKLESQSEVIDNRMASILTPKITGNGEVVIYFETPSTLIWDSYYNPNQEHFLLFGENLTAKQEELVLAIFKTIKFDVVVADETYTDIWAVYGANEDYLEAAQAEITSCDDEFCPGGIHFDVSDSFFECFNDSSDASVILIQCTEIDGCVANYETTFEEYIAMREACMEDMASCPVYGIGGEFDLFQVTLDQKRILKMEQVYMP